MKNIIISTDYFCRDSYNVEKFIEVLLENNNDFHYLILTKDTTKGQKLVDFLIKNYNLNCSFIKRSLSNISNNFEFIIGNKNQDFFLATNRKKIIFYDKNIPTEEKVENYGVYFDLSFLNKILKISLIDNNPYFFIKINDNFQVISLINAMSKKGGYDIDEQILIKNFEDFLKGRCKKNSYFLFIYIIFTIQKLNIEKPDYIFFYPSSQSNVIQPIEEIVKHLRNFYHLPINSHNLFERNKSVTPSKLLDKNERLYCDRHFESINLYNDYILKNKNIWVLDDYCTNGTSFEVVRNFLKSAGAKSITCISVGKFKTYYYIQNYNHDNSTLLKSLRKDGFINECRNTIDKLLEIINS